MNELLLDYLPLVIFIAVAIGIAMALLVVPFIVAYMRPDPEKLSAYECGFNTQEHRMSDCMLAQSAIPACVGGLCADTRPSP